MQKLRLTYVKCLLLSKNCVKLLSDTHLHRDRFKYLTFVALEAMT